MPRRPRRPKAHTSGQRTSQDVPSGLMADCVLWLIAAGVVGVAEMLTPAVGLAEMLRLTFVLGLRPAPAPPAAVPAGVRLPPADQLGVFAGAGLLLIGV